MINIISLIIMLGQGEQLMSDEFIPTRVTIDPVRCRSRSSLKTDREFMREWELGYQQYRAGTIVSAISDDYIQYYETAVLHWLRVLDIYEICN